MQSNNFDNSNPTETVYEKAPDFPKQHFFYTSTSDNHSPETSFGEELYLSPLVNWMTEKFGTIGSILISILLLFLIAAICRNAGNEPPSTGYTETCYGDMGCTWACTSPPCYSQEQWEAQSASALNGLNQPDEFEPLRQFQQSKFGQP